MAEPFKFGQKSHSRLQMEAEMKANPRRRATKPSKFGLIIPEGSEDEIQATFIDWVDKLKGQHPVLENIFAIPNAGFASKKQGALRKLTGRRSGVPDINLPVKGWAKERHATMVNLSLCVGLWIEFKRPGEKPTKEQLAWHERLRAEGHRVEICYSWTEGANTVIEYLGLRLEKL